MKGLGFPSMTPLSMPGLAVLSTNNTFYFHETGKMLK
jgi:hypothetical protein